MKESTRSKVPAVKDLNERKTNLLKVIISVNLFNESWSDKEDRFRLSFLKSLQYTGLHVNNVETIFNLKFKDGLCDNNKLGILITESIKLIINLFELSEEPSRQVLRYLLIKAQLVLIDIDICPFDYYDDSETESENLREVKDNKIELINEEIADLESKLPSSVVESLKSTNFGVYNT